MRRTRLTGHILAWTIIAGGLGATLSISSQAQDDESGNNFEVVLQPDLTAAIEQEFEIRLERVENGEDISTVTEWNPPALKRFTIEKEEGMIETYQSAFASDPKPEALSLQTFEAILPLLEECDLNAAKGQPISVYKTELTKGQYQGKYTVDCRTGSKSQRNNLSTDTEIAAVMASDSLSIKEKKARARGMKAGELIGTFKRNNPNPTRQQRFDHCIETFSILNESYRYHNQAKQSPGDIQQQCESAIEQGFLLETNTGN